MRLISIILLSAMLLVVICNGESTTIILTIEISEFDCTEHPDLFEEYVSLNNAFSSSKSESRKVEQKKESEILAEMELKVTKTIVLKHSQEVEIGDKVNQSTQIEGSDLKLIASTEEKESGLIYLDIEFSLRTGEYTERGVDTVVAVQRGHYVSLGGATSSTSTQDESGEEKETRIVTLIRSSVE